MKHNPGKEMSPWLTVTGYGSHISASGRALVIRKGGAREEYPLAQVRHLLIMGGHSLQTSAVLHLLKQGSLISFFSTDGVPLGTAMPFGETRTGEVRDAQHRDQGHRYALEFIRESCRARILYLEEVSHSREEPLLMRGELEILHQAFDEIEFLVTMEELRRVFRLITNMYYEVLARSVPPSYGFRRRTDPPQRDTINAVLTFGYSMLFGNGMISVVAAGLDPDTGFLSQGERSLVYDLIEAHKVAMIDRPVFEAVWSGRIREDMGDCNETRCILCDMLIRELIRLFQGSIDQVLIDSDTSVLVASLLDNRPFSLGR